VKFSVDLDISGAVRLTNAIAKQIPFAMAKALTLTAIQAQTDIVQAMMQVFDRPTPYALNSTYVIPATKDRLESFVQLKDSAAKGTPAIKFLDPEVFGGERNPKRGEKVLQRMGALASGSFIAPGAGLKLDRYGNISAGTMTKVLSAVQANPDYYQNVTQKSRKRFCFCLRARAIRLRSGQALKARSTRTHLPRSCSRNRESPAARAGRLRRGR